MSNGEHVEEAVESSKIHLVRGEFGYEMAGRTKAAVVLLSLPEEKAIEVLQRLGSAEVEALAREAANLDVIPGDALRQVVAEFAEKTERFRFVQGGGAKRIQELVQRALPAAEAEKINNRVQNDHKPPPFTSLASAPVTQAVEFLRSEHPQTVALVLAHTDRDTAAHILANLDEEAQADIALRLLRIAPAPPDVLTALDEQLRLRMAPSEEGPTQEAAVDGLKRLVDILGMSPRNVEQKVLEYLMEADEEMYNEVRKAMFMFEDLVTLDGRSVQRLLRDIDSSDLTLALKAASEDLQALFFGNMSERAALILKEDMQFMGAIRVRDAQEAQQRILNAARNLEAAGELVIPRGGADALIE
ncbi:MAG: flagellar motor switch protein FliG [Armatimonadetes bacterium]|nr:flagellar motor switch protein FliG [Armatimonadota bacterium]